jgi:hypothetical protein
MESENQISNCKMLIQQLVRKNKDPTLALKNYNIRIFEIAKTQLTPKIISADQLNKKGDENAGDDANNGNKN